MQRKPGFPVSNCNIRMPDSIPPPAEATIVEEDTERRRLQLINFGHSQWGFNNWSWAVTKQDLDFVDFSNGKYAVGVVAFVTVTVKSLDIHRENIGYATSVAPTKGSAIYQARKGAVTNALRETLLSFGGTVSTELLDLLETLRPESVPAPAEPLHEINQNHQNLPKNINEQRNRRKESPECVPPAPAPAPVPVPMSNVVNAVNVNIRTPHPPPVARAAPMPASKPPGPPPRAPLPPPQRNSNDKGMEGMTEEEARAERKRRQRQAQEEFRLKQSAKKSEDPPDKSELQKSTFDKFLSDISTPEVLIQETGTGDKRKSPEPGNGSAPKRRASFINKLDIVQGD